MSHRPHNTPASPTQAQQFLERMRQMGPGAAQIFREIYAQAPHGHSPTLPRGHHVRHAMIAALTHPEIAYWCRMNLAVRVARKLAQTTGQHTTLQRLDQTLEAFHRAADAFSLRQPLTTALHRPRPQAVSSHLPLQALPVGVGLAPEEISLVQRFKSQIVPGLVQRIRAGGIA
ncbi:hypothetical protein [Vampirovibrio chlorellavorus]|uniref:hypothetical protein n=1 Tax=Vampirovibrio chlorellavorus TaxID=758823 RepID=UPI0026EE241C|nr:hypothetical protein [Vampirovibrio chlorellavorus]